MLSTGLMAWHVPSADEHLHRTCRTVATETCLEYACLPPPWPAVETFIVREPCAISTMYVRRRVCCRDGRPRLSRTTDDDDGGRWLSLNEPPNPPVSRHVGSTVACVGYILRADRALQQTPIQPRPRAPRPPSPGRWVIYQGCICVPRRGRMETG